MNYYSIIPSNYNITSYLKNQIFFRKKQVFPEERNEIIGSNQNSECETQNNRLTTYIRCIFHDFRGPLNNITLSTDILLNSDQVKSDNENYELIKGIKESCIFLSETLDGFLNVSYIDTDSIDNLKLTYEPFNVIGLIKKIQYILLSNLLEKNIKLIYDIGILHEWVIGDYKHIQHVLMNLVSNAIKFSKNDTIIIIKLKCKEYNENKELLIFSIIDQNPIIRDSIKKSLFEKYTTSNDTKGNGLGLYICKKIIESHGGKISYSKYTETNGNIFNIELKLEVCPTSSNQTVSEKKNIKHIKEYDQSNEVDISQNAIISKKTNTQMLLYNHYMESSVTLSTHGKNRGKLKMLIVDDSELSRKLMVKMIDQKYKDRVVIYQSIDGLDGLITMIKMNEKNNTIDVILLDNVMPNLTGEMLAKILRGMNYNGLIFGITGNGLEEDVKNYLDCGANYIFIKPFNHDKLKSLFQFIEQYDCKNMEGKKIIEESKGVLKWEED